MDMNKGWGAGGKGGAGWRTTKGRKKWDNCNSIFNKIYFNKEPFQAFRKNVDS